MAGVASGHPWTSLGTSCFVVIPQLWCASFWQSLADREKQENRPRASPNLEFWVDLLASIGHTTRVVLKRRFEQ